MNVEQNSKHTNVLKDILGFFAFLAPKLALQPDEVAQFNTALEATAKTVADIATASNPISAVEGAVSDGAVVASDVATLAATVTAETAPVVVAAVAVAPVQQADPTPAPVVAPTVSVVPPVADDTSPTLTATPAAPLPFKFDPYTGLPIT